MLLHHADVFSLAESFFARFPVSASQRPPQLNEIRKVFALEKASCKRLYYKWLYKQQKARAEAVLERFRLKRSAPSEQQVSPLV